jgi:dephospho-CoA kinase
VIGLTGNIATGKSVVRRMLEHLGAYTIDADALSHRVISKGAPGYQPVLDKFGTWLWMKTGRSTAPSWDAWSLPIHRRSRSSKPSSIHMSGRPWTCLIRAPQKVVVIEAIKLLESDLRKRCDSIWVTDAPQEVQVERLMRKRGMSREDAHPARPFPIGAEAKAGCGDSCHHQQWIVRGSVETGQRGVEDRLPTQEAGPRHVTPKPAAGIVLPATRQAARFTKDRRPADPPEQGQARHEQDHVMEAFGDKAFLLLQLDEELVGIAGWQVENLVARTTDLYLDPRAPAEKALPLIMAKWKRPPATCNAKRRLSFRPWNWSASIRSGNILATKDVLLIRWACRHGRMPRSNPCRKVGSLLQTAAHRQRVETDLAHRKHSEQLDPNVEINEQGRKA